MFKSVFENLKFAVLIVTGVVVFLGIGLFLLWLNLNMHVAKCNMATEVLSWF
jgi:hypothetical protein